MKRLAVLVLLLGCKHPEALKAEAAAQTESRAGTGAKTEAAAKVETAAAVQSGSSSSVTVKRPPRHLGLSVTPSSDGGMPTFTLELDEGEEEISATSSADADAGASSSADAGAASSADAGATSSADAGATASVQPAPKPFWSFSRLVTLLVGLGLLAAGVFAVLRAIRKV